MSAALNPDAGVRSGSAGLRRRSLEDRLVIALTYTVMVAFALSILYPFWSMLVDSFNTPAASVQDRLKLWPAEMTLINYEQVFGNAILGTAYLNSVFKTAAGTSVILLVSFTAAFGLADRTLPGIKAITFFMVFTMFFSGGLIPTFLWYKQLGLLNTRIAWVLHLAVSAYYIIIMRNFFREIPAEMTESATIDGAGLTQVL